MVEEAFVYLILEKDFKPGDLAPLHLAHSYNRSRWWWKKKYSREMKLRESRMKSFVMRGNNRGYKDAPAIIIDKAKLLKAVSQGRAIENMAKMFCTTPFLVKENLRRYGIEHTPTAPTWIDRFLEVAPQLEYFAPGITQAGINYNKDKERFFQLSNNVFLATLNIADIVEDLVKGKWASSREAGTAEKGSLCFNRNRHERKLSAELASAKIAHTREFMFEKPYRADFFIVGTKLLIELDGEYHREEVETKERDIIRRKAAKDNGYEMLHYDIRTPVQKIVEDLKCKLNLSQK